MKNNLTDRVFGRLRVLRENGCNRQRAILWECECACGTIKNFVGSRLIAGRVKSCGCLAREMATQRLLKHGSYFKGKRSRGYVSWVNMKMRCYNPNDKRYSDYGGRGIKVCDRWLHSFENFLEDMGQCPEKHTLDRIDNDGDYCPDNCRWATRKEQQNNRRFNHKIKHDGLCLNLTQWAEKLGVSSYMIYKKIKTDPTWVSLGRIK
jgi:hypothetical protein